MFAVSIGRVVADVISYALAHWLSVTQSDKMPVNVRCPPLMERQVWEAAWSDMTMVDAGRCSERAVRATETRYGKVGDN